MVNRSLIFIRTQREFYIRTGTECFLPDRLFIFVKHNVHRCALLNDYKMKSLK
jgi:hypothetical protein